MKTIIKKTRLTAIALTLMSFLFLSFSATKGGEGFEIYLNSKLVLQQFGSNMNTVKTIELEKSAANGSLSVKYHHCGKQGKNRTITIKDVNDKILKEWKYPDVSATALSVSDGAMVCKVSDLMSLQKSNSGKLSLYYSSSELPKGRLLATIVVTAGNVAKQ